LKYSRFWWGTVFQTASQAESQHHNVASKSQSKILRALRFYLFTAGDYNATALMDAVAAHFRSHATPLNLFQRLVLQWETLHPYNAAQVLKIAGPADPDAMATAWRDTLNTLGLGRVQRTGGRIQHQALNGELQRYPIQILAPGESLCDFITGELNRAFDDPTEPPFRAFILNQGDHHYAGIVYQHWVADSVSIRLVLREWFLRRHRPELARRTPLHHTRGGYWSLLGPPSAGWNLGTGLLNSVRWSCRNRRVARLENTGPSDFNCRFSLHEIGSGVIAPLLAFARRNKATLNDLFLAVVAEVCNRFVPLRKTQRRTDLALGTIVDLRPYSQQDLSDTFGLFLGFTSTVCRPAELADFSRLLKAVALQSQLHRKTNMPLSSPVRMLAGLTVGKLYERKRIIEFYRKRVPLAGGISNVNLNRSWAARFYPDPIMDYIRVSPTGPMMPLVFTPTTLGDQLRFGLTYRPSVIPPGDAAKMAELFRNRLKTIAGQL